MSSENNQASSDPLDVAVAALRGAASADEGPSPALVAATINALRRLDVTLPSNPLEGTAAVMPSAPPASDATGEKQPFLIVAKSSGRIRRAVLSGAALAAAVCVAVVVTRPPEPPPTSSEDHRFGPIVVAE